MKAIQNKLYEVFSEKFLGLAPRYKIMFLWILFLCLVPLFGGYVATEFFLFGNIYILYATSWDLLSGYTGQESFGHSLFVGLGGYMAGFMSYRLAEMGILNVHLPFAVNLILGAGIAAIFGFILGVPALKLKGPFLALITLASAELAHHLIMFFGKYTNGEEALSGISAVSNISSDINYAYYISIILVAVGVGAAYFISRSKYGTLLKAIREDDPAAQAIGINTVKFRVGTFMISAALTGLAGTFHAYYLGSAGTTLVAGLSIEIITFAVVGGIGTIVGPIGGVYFLWFLSSYLIEPFMGLIGLGGKGKVAIYMLVMVLVMVVMPKGIWATVVDKIKASYQKWKKEA